MKIVINTCFGGFGLSHKAVMRYAELKGINLQWKVDDISKKYHGDDPNASGTIVHYYKDSIDDKNYFSTYEIQRDDLDLIEVVKELGKHANGHCAELSIVEIPDGVEWGIHDYDGNEHVEEQHRTWR